MTAKERFIKELEEWKSLFKQDVLQVFTLGHSKQGSFNFAEWQQKFNDFLTRNIPEEAEKFSKKIRISVERGKLLDKTGATSESIFMKIYGNLCLSFIDNLIELASKGHIIFLSNNEFSGTFRLSKEVSSTNQPKESNKPVEYDAALSFAGEDRVYVEEVANELKRLGVRVFYDKFETAKLWGKDLYTYLQDIYQNKANYTIIFISEHYAKKLWTNHEKKMAQARAFTESREYILPAKFDDTEIEGIPKTTGYIDLRHLTPVEFCNVIYEKLQLIPNEMSYLGNIIEDYKNQADTFSVIGLSNYLNKHQEDLILSEIRKHKEGVTITELTFILQISQSFGHKLMYDLEKKGKVVRRNGKDLRQKYYFAADLPEKK